MKKGKELVYNAFKEKVQELGIFALDEAGTWGLGEPTDTSDETQKVARCFSAMLASYVFMGLMADLEF